MDFKLSEEQQMLANTVERLVRDTYTFEARRRIVESEQGFSAEVWQQLGDLGLLGVPFSDRFGGFNGSGVELMVVAQGFGRGLVVEPWLATVVLAGTLINGLGSDRQRQSLLPAIIAGRLRLALALYEPQGRYDHTNIAMRARKGGQGYVLDGDKAMVLHGDSADQLVVIARSDGDSTTRGGLSAFLVPSDAAGVTRKGYRTIDGLRAADITFQGVQVRADALLGAEGQALDALEHTLDLALVCLCAEAAGAMEVACDQTLEYLKQRRQFGQPIGAFQALQHRMVDMRIELEKVRSITMLAACSVDRPLPIRAKRIAAAKAQVGKSGQHVAEEAIQLHGGMGMMQEAAISHYAKRIIMLDHWLGDRDYHLARLEKCIEAGAAAAHSLVAAENGF